MNILEMKREEILDLGVEDVNRLLTSDEIMHMVRATGGSLKHRNEKCERRKRYD